MYADCRALFKHQHSKCWHSIHDLLLGGDVMMYLYLRRYFVRKHRRKGSFNFHRYIVLCMGSEFPQTMELTALDWMLATGTVLFRDYFFSIWASALSLFFSLLVGIKLHGIARMVVSDTRNMLMTCGDGDSGGGGHAGRSGDYVSSSQDNDELATTKEVERQRKQRANVEERRKLRAEVCIVQLSYSMLHP